MNNLLFAAFFLTVFVGCSIQPAITIKVDMSYERDQGRFDPEEGDILSMVSTTNEWEYYINVNEKVSNNKFTLIK